MAVHKATAAFQRPSFAVYRNAICSAIFTTLQRAPDLVHCADEQRMGKKRLTSEDEARVALLRERLFLTVLFIENVQTFPSGPAIRGIVQNAARKGDLRSLRLVARDIDAMALSLPSQEREGLEAVLSERLGIDNEEERIEMHRSIARILKRGTIASERERRRLQDYIEMLEATEGDPEQIEAVRQCLENG